MNLEYPYKIPIGRWVEESVTYITEQGEFFFRSVSKTLEFYIQLLTEFLKNVQPEYLILVCVFAVWITKKNFFLGVLISVALALIYNLELWGESIETVVLVYISAFIAMILGVPLGILLARNPRFYSLIRPLLDGMQTVPTFVYLIPTLMLFGLGVVPGLISTIVFVIPTPIRMTRLALLQVPKSLLETSDAFGASRFQKLIKIEWPWALPMIQASMGQCIMLSLSMVVISALVGADGLGKSVVQALNTVNLSKGFEAGLVIVLLAMMLERIMVSSSVKKADDYA